MTSEEMHIWNRAAMSAGGKEPLEGDRALAALLGVHGPIMNGGLGDAFICCGEPRYAEGVEAFRYFGLVQVAALLERAAKLPEEEAEELSSEYWELIPSDSTIVHAFLQKHAACPEVFAAVGGESHV